VPIKGGLKRNSSDFVGDGFITEHNTSRYYSEELGRRWGLADRNDVGGRVMVSLRESDGDNFIIRYTTDGKLQSTLTTYSSTVNSLKTGLSTTAVGSFAQLGKYTYYSNGSDNVQTITTGTAATRDSGLTAPSTWVIPAVSGSGLLTAGTHKIRIRFQDSTTGYISDPSPTLSFVSAGDDTLSLVEPTAWEADDCEAHGDKVIVEMTTAGGTVFYDAEYENNTDTSTITVSISDLDLVVQQRRALGADTGNSAPPNGSIFVEHKNRLFMMGVAGALQELYWSGSSKPEGWSTVSQARLVWANSGDEPQAMFSFQGDLYIAGLRAMRRLNYVNKPTDGLITDVQTYEGCWNQQCSIEVNGGIYGWGPSGMWQLRGIIPQLISGDIDSLLNSEIVDTNSAKFHMTYDDDEDVLLYFYTSSAGTSPDKAFCFDLKTKEWSTRSYEHEITASCVCIAADGRVRAALATDDDTQWVLKPDLYDGITSGSNAVATATGTPTDTIISVTETLQTAQTLKGVKFYDVVSGETRIIASNTSSQITLATALTTAPAAGAEFWLGSAEMTIEPKWLNGVEVRLQPKRTELMFVAPSAAGGRIDFYRYRDQSETALIVASQPDDTDNNGITINDLADHIRVDPYGAEGDGYINVPYWAAWSRTWKWKMVHRKPSFTFRLLHAEDHLDKVGMDEDHQS